jgi:beta-lactamase regulating signal transducer with metallopeptidase domain
MLWLPYIASNVFLATLLAVVAWCVQCRLGRPAVARFLWVLALLKLVTPPLVSVPLVELPPAMACKLGVCNCHHTGTHATVVRILPWVLLAAWTAGAGATLITASRRWSRFQRLLLHANPAPPEWQRMAARLAGELSMGRVPEVLVTPSQLPPLTAPGWTGARIVLPIELLPTLNAAQREALLLHELAHIKRRDDLVRLLELVVLVAYWWLPIVGSIGRQLRACEETCCDDAVVAHRPHARRDYARLLLEVVDFAHPLPPHAPQAMAMSAADGLEQRLRGILNATQQAQRTWPLVALPIVLACAVLPCDLRYDFIPSDSAARAVCATTFDGCDRAGTATPSFSSDHAVPHLATFCCPR